MADPKRTVRTATAEDAAAIHEIHQRGSVEDVAERLEPAGAVPGTTFHVVEDDGEVIAVFTLVELGRLRPASLPRLLMYEMRMRPRYRGTNVVDDVLTWLEGHLGVGRERELLLLTPVDQFPSAFRRFATGPSHQVVKWGVPEPDSILERR
ncbi:hypothetical protein ATKI12_0036 [Kitasatospora sp. Ki12]